MLAVISPAKRLDFEKADCPVGWTIPEKLEQSAELMGALRKMSVPKLMELMGVSRELAELNRQRFADWRPPFDDHNAKRAVLAFQGDVYLGLQSSEFRSRDFEFAQKHLRILSGLHGVLKPLDLIQPYRLEMGTPLRTKAGKNLYEYWGEQITEMLNEALDEQGDRVLVNLASAEYFKSVNCQLLSGRVICPQFKEARGKDFKMIGAFAKKARGMMCRYLIQNRLGFPENLRSFSEEGYSFNERLSSDEEWVFTRG